MASDLVDVLLVGQPDPEWSDRLQVEPLQPSAATGFAVRSLDDDRDLDLALAARMPHVIVSFGDVGVHQRLARQNLEVRRRWIHVDDPSTEAGPVAEQVLGAFIDVTTQDRFPEHPLISVYTPVYRTGDLIVRAYRSLRAQTYDNWEWVVHDDSPDDETFELLRRIARSDHRLRLFRSDRPSGVIGEVKRRCCGLARGSVLVELDHDDELTPRCLEWLVEAFASHPEAGFAYTDCAEVFEDGSPASYGETFAFGFGSYRREVLDGREFLVMNYPSINSKTVRHIVGMPNHVRAWRRSAYEAAGGYAPDIHVADDYELCLRTFLTTRIVHIRRFGYIQYLHRSGANTQRVRNAEIQRLVALFAQRYESEIRDRFDELDVDDFIRADDVLDWSRPAPEPVPIANLIVE